MKSVVWCGMLNKEVQRKHQANHPLQQLLVIIILHLNHLDLEYLLDLSVLPGQLNVIWAFIETLYYEIYDVFQLIVDCT